MTAAARMRTLARVAPAAVMLAALVLIGPGGALAPAEAATGPADDAGVVVSDDGAHYADQIADPLFDGFGRLVPGDSETVTLWARNDGELAGVLRLSGTDAWSSTAEFASAISVVATVPGGAVETPIPLQAAAECALVLSGPLLDPGESVPIALTVAFSSEVTGRTGADDQAGLDFVVALRDPSDPASDTADCSSGTVVPGAPDEGDAAGGPGRGGRVADTGGAVGPPLAVGLLALLSGLSTLAVLAGRDARRRRAVR